MSNSLPAARFPALPLSKEKAAAEPIYKDTAVTPVDVADEALLRQISAGDRDALALLFRRYARLVWSVAERIVQNKTEADDLLQDVFLLIQRKASVFDSSKGPARSLILHMTYQCALSRRRYLNARHYQATREAEENAAKVAAPAAPLYHASVEAHFGRERLRKALGEMSEEQRETLRLYFFEGYSLVEIAVRLGQSPGNVRHHYYRGLDKLQRNIPRKGNDECLAASYRDERKTEQGRDSITTATSPSPVVGRFPTRKSGDGNCEEQRLLLGPEYFAGARLQRVPRGSL
jgi:RNA polymerase sigma-70 factor (ECF subfamily)